MKINLKNKDQIAQMRIAGQLAAEVLEMITPYVNPGVSTEELDRRCYEYIVNEQNSTADNYFYRVNFPKLYQTSIYVKKFEKDYNRVLEYRFLKAYPISINSMPVTYEASQLLKCTVNFNFSRYVVETMNNIPIMGPLQQNGVTNNAITLNV